MHHSLREWTALTVLVAVAACASKESDVTAPATLDLAYARPVSPTEAIPVIQLPAAGASAEAYAINDAGEVAGIAGSFPARWSPSASGWTIQRLTTGTGRANDINESGSVAATAGGMVTLWRRDGTTEAIAPGYAVALNEAEVVVGLRDAPNRATAWVRSGSTWTAHTLPRLAGITTGVNEPSSINNDGVIVGYSFDATGTQHAVKWMPSQSNPGEWDEATPIDAFAGVSNSAALAIDGSNIGGLAFRCSVPSDASTCVSRDPRHWGIGGNATIGSLGTADAWVEGLNASRYMVGPTGSRSKGSWVMRGFVWTPAEPILRDLGMPKGFEDAWPKDINNPTATRSAKQIAGFLHGSGGKSSAVLWILQ